MNHTQLVYEAYHLNKEGVNQSREV